MKIIVEGNPMPLQRARAGKSGFYDPQFIAKRNFAHIVKEQYKEPPITTAISLTVTFNMQMPKSWSKKKKILMLGTEHIQTPDTSNLLKFTEDALLKILWMDDCLISEIHAEKIWADKGSTIIEIGEQ